MVEEGWWWWWWWSRLPIFVVVVDNGGKQELEDGYVLLKVGGWSEGSGVIYMIYVSVAGELGYKKN